MHSSRMRTARTLTGWRTPLRMENPPGWRTPRMENPPDGEPPWDGEPPLDGEPPPDGEPPRWRTPLWTDRHL